ncbi:hypothetical protein BDR22DRAFT_879071 [Usnea florida]
MGQLGGLSPQGSVVLGIFVGLISTSVQSLGLTLQRKSHILEDEKDPNDPRRPPHRRRRWQSGLVFNSICATVILGEPFTRWSFGGTVLVCGGAVLIAVFGAIGEPAHNLDQLLALLKRRQFILWMVAQAVLVVAIVAGSKALKYMNPWTNNAPRMRLYRGMAYGAVSGILSAHSLLVAKSAVELLVRTIVDRHNEFDRWQSWTILVGLLILALTQLYYLHRGLKLCSTSILYPFVFCVYNIIAIVDGLIYFDQSSRLSVLHALFIALGTMILLAGVLALSWRLNNESSTRPTVSQNTLTPGMGFVDDNIDSEAEGNSLCPQADEEANLANGKELPLHNHHNAHHISSPCASHTSTTRSNEMLSITRMRRKGITESEEIWEELADDAPAELSPFSRRRSSVRSAPFSKILFQGKPLDENVNESTALLTRSGTGRSYRDRKRRRSTPIMEPQESERRKRSVSSRLTFGGWWMTKQWWRGKEGKDKGKGIGNDNGGGEDT